MTHFSDPDRPPHQAREVAGSFGSDASRYERARPAYPEALISRLVESAPGPDVVDVGCGTGIAGRQLQAAGCRVLGVEPDERMAQLARQSGLPVEAATFEEWDPGVRTFDAVVAAQAWHWVDPDAGAVQAARVLRSNGRFAAFWNVFVPPAEIAHAFADAYRRVPTGLPFNPWAVSPLDAYQTMGDRTAEGLGRCGRFGQPERWRFDWEHVYDRDGWLDMVPTFGGHTQIPAPELDRLLAALGGAIDAAGGSFTMGYATVVVTATRVAGPPPG
jgi:SAM-dependent methyltransferase